MMAALHLPHATVVRLHVRKNNVIIFKTENGGRRWCLSSSLSLSVGLSVQDEAMDVARCAPTGGSLPCGRYLLPPLTGNKEGSKGFWYSELSLHQLGSRPTVFIPRWTTHPCILYQVCATRGARFCCWIRSSSG